MCRTVCSTFLIITFFLHYFAIAKDLKYDEEKLGEQFIAKEDAEEMRKRMAAEHGEGYGTDWIMMPDGDGKPQMAVLKKGQGTKFFGFGGSDAREDGAEETKIEDEVLFQLYTRKNPVEGQQILAKPESTKASDFDASKPTKIIIHGWKSSGDSETVLNIKNAYLEKSDMNVVGVDWSGIASNYYYPTPAGETTRVGQHVGSLIETFVEHNGARYEDFHIVGHSLGAHAAGAAGSSTKKKVSRVTGLDPALPGFEYYQLPEGKLDENDAEFVEVIHTCSGALGMSSPTGHADFYPNGGSPFQPGCCCMPEFTEACSHGRAHKYFAESIISETGFVATKCSNWSNFKNGECENYEVRMGEFTPPKTRGVYYLLTNSSAPYALGPVGARYFTDESR